MNIVLWILQVVLALQALAGGAFKLFGFDAVSKEPFYAALPRGGWSTLGALEVVCGLFLIIPAALKWQPQLTPLAAVVLAVESLGLAVLYARYSTQLAATNPLVWVVLMAIVAAFIAYGRYVLSPLIAR